MLEFPRRQQRDRLGQHGRRQQRAYPAGVGGCRAARDQIVLVVGECFGDRAWPTASRILAASERAGLVLRLPPRENVLAVGILVVIGDTDNFGPVATMAIGDFNHPSARAFAATIAECDPGAYAGEVVGLAAHRQFEAGGASFEAGSTRAAGHNGFSSVGGVPECVLNMGVEAGGSTV